MLKSIRKNNLLIIVLFSLSFAFGVAGLIYDRNIKANAREYIQTSTIIPTSTVVPTLTVEELANETKQRELPPKDTSLPKKNFIIIPKLGVNAEIKEGSDWEKALKEGPWRVPDFNSPSGNALFKSDIPTIIASHVYGYDSWDEDFRDRVSFSGLDSLQVGDQLEIIWQQRKYIYVIADGEVNDKISNYNHDLIVYTCKDLSASEQRIIRYAKLV